MPETAALAAVPTANHALVALNLWAFDLSAEYRVNRQLIFCCATFSHFDRRLGHQHFHQPTHIAESWSGGTANIATKTSFATHHWDPWSGGKMASLACLR